jgi:hypothetical protein
MGKFSWAFVRNINCSLIKFASVIFSGDVVVVVVVAFGIFFIFQVEKLLVF